MAEIKVLILDIETAPNRVYTWGLFKQTVALNQIEEPGYTLCFAAKWLNKPGVIFKSTYHDGRETMLRSVYKLLDKADVVAHYNGTKFDIPTLNQEFMARGWPPPAPFQEVDVLRTVRRRFNLTSNKLDYVLRVLDIPGKVQHKGMALWRECMAGIASAWNTMRRYNIGDVTKLEKVYKRILPWIINHPNMALYNPSGKLVCPVCGSTRLQKRGFQYTATQKYQRYQCQKCTSWSRERFTAVKPKDRKNILKDI